MSAVLSIRFCKDDPQLEMIDDVVLKEGAADSARLLLPFGFWGHYDWLRDKSQKVVGARWYPNDHEFPTNLREFFTQVENLPYCVLGKGRILTVFFFRETRFLEEYSQDQELDSSSIILLDPKEQIFGLLLNNPPQELVVHKA